MLSEPTLDRDRGGDRHLRGIEADEEAITRRRYLLAAVRGEHLSKGRVVPCEHGLPGLVAERYDEIRRADDVGEHERLHDPPRRTGLAAELPRQELLRVLEDDRGSRASECGGAKHLLVHAVGAHDIGLAEIAGQPVERRRRERDAVPCSDAFVPIHARANGHQRDPTAARPRNARDVASARLEAPSCAWRPASRRATTSSSSCSSLAISALVRPSVSRRSSWRSASSTSAAESFADAPATNTARGASIGPASSTS